MSLNFVRPDKAVSCHGETGMNLRQLHLAGAHVQETLNYACIGCLRKQAGEAWLHGRHLPSTVACRLPMNDQDQPALACPRAYVRAGLNPFAYMGLDGTAQDCSIGT